MPGLDRCEGGKLITSLETFLSNIQEHSGQKLNEYEETSNNLCTIMYIEYSDLKKRQYFKIFR